MSRNRFFALIAVAIIVSVAGCSGVLPGTDDSSGTPMGDQTSERTPTASPIPERTVSTPSPTATPTPTPVPDIVREHRDFGRAIGEELRKHSDIDEDWIRTTTGEKRTTVIVVRKPPKWTIKRTEMEVVRESVRLTKWRSSPDVEPGDMSVQNWHRPEKVHIVVQSRKGNVASQLSLDTELAVQYADRDMTLDEFASQLSNTRKVEHNVSVGENSTAYYLKMAEWRQLRKEQLRILDLYENFSVRINDSSIRPEQGDIYYRHKSGNLWRQERHKGQLLTTYWEAVRNVTRQRLVHRYPKRMRAYANIPDEPDIEYWIYTKDAFAFIAATDGDPSDQNILLDGSYDLYYGNVTEIRHQDDE